MQQLETASSMTTAIRLDVLLAQTVRVVLWQLVQNINSHVRELSQGTSLMNAVC